MAGVWHARGMANYKVGTALVCIKDYGKIKQGESGAIVKEDNTVWSGSTWHLSFVEGSKKESCKHADMEKHFVII